MFTVNPIFSWRRKKEARRSKKRTKEEESEKEGRCSGWGAENFFWKKELLRCYHPWLSFLLAAAVAGSNPACGSFFQKSIRQLLNMPNWGFTPEFNLPASEQNYSCSQSDFHHPTASKATNAPMHSSAAKGQLCSCNEEQELDIHFSSRLAGSIILSKFDRWFYGWKRQWHLIQHSAHCLSVLNEKHKQVQVEDLYSLNMMIANDTPHR